MEVDFATIPEPVRALIASQAARIALQQQGLAERGSEIARLKAQLAKLRRLQFGRSSEKLDTAIAQLELALEELEAVRSWTGASSRAASRSAAPTCSAK